MNLEPIARLWHDASAATEGLHAGPTMDSRYHGVLLGAAVGNLLGIPVEGVAKGQIKELVPGGVRYIDPEELQRPWDDDVAQTVILAEVLLAGETLDLEYLAQRFAAWARESGRGIGNLTRRVLREIGRGTAASEAARRVWEQDGHQPAGNGAVMRCSPVALRWRRQPYRLVEETMKSAVVTHHDPRCQWSAVALNVALAHSLEGRTIPLTVLADAIDDAGAPAALGEAVRHVDGHSLDDLALDDPHSMGYTLKAMQAGLWALRQSNGFEEVMLAVVNSGGDTDTNGAVAGAVMGGKHGDPGIPDWWLRCVPGRDRLERLADRLLEACG